ncbi:hypothetical protein N7489_010198 [Penicillium chrysogenum]|uniref:DUF7708 domain-containing protein n=1 Tax=Penicillium chrysogenum TaxID=5076 RepID=A0ABQ8WUM7_PENCH|nr:uncharacterized protein N7489_010198 [Penicillium chrysogenum]KAJ5229490.1 hypothetical protein N7489_010198 [Penicillium chrysogenum]KAJ5258894.1 hypothetical protein N7524_010450 [Penicillium chrysogenum]KAJ5282626.1 hypothetical protein N7505_000606 [Penicillium chrysogenum]KAJ6169368.1 hypothetical protein N7497_002211 [Penicillium chrysogenum]
MAKQPVAKFPVRHSTNIPASFIENHQTTAEDEEKIKFVHRINSFLPEKDAAQDELECKQRIEESFKSTTNNVQALNEALDAFRLKLCKPGQFQVSQPMPSGQKVHWSDVMKELQNAQNYYKTRHGGGPIGKAISKFGRYTESLKGWLDLLPAGDYGSTICGGLKLLLSALDETHKLDSLVFVALSDIPEILYEARFYLDAYRVPRLSINMLEKMADLCNHVLIVLREIVYYCLESKSRHFISTVFKGPNSKDSLRQTISDLRERATSLSREAELTNHQTIQNINEDIQGIKQSSHNIEGSRTDIYVNLYVLYSGHPSLDSKGELLSDSMDASPRLSLAGVQLQNSISANPSPGIQPSRSPSITDLPDLRDLLTLCVNSQSNDHLNVPQRTHRRHQSFPKPEEPLITTEGLLHLLAFDETKVASDRGTNVHPSRFNKCESQKLPFITRSAQFQNWINKTERKNASLLVQGHFDSEDGTSALTHLCARIAYESAPDPKVLILTHFCSLHTASRAEIGRRAGATGLIASLIGQLLSYDSHRVQFDLSQITKHALSRIEEFSLKKLCWLFGMLITQVKKGITMICIIDNISSYETDEAVGDLEQLVRCLQTWVIRANQTSSKPRMKLLITDTNQTTRVYRYFQHDDILNLEGESGDDWEDDSEEDSWII